MDWLHVKKSQIPRSGYGLYASVDIPKNTFFSIYLGRVVELNDPKRKYIIEMKKTFVHSRKGGSQWKPSRKGRKNTIIDALMSYSKSKVAQKIQLHLGSHLMNDPNFGGKKSDFEANVVFNALLEAITTRHLSAGESYL